MNNELHELFSAIS